jgi:tetratricopeptide (TPR) repeat protein
MPRHVALALSALSVAALISLEVRAQDEASPAPETSPALEATEPTPTDADPKELAREAFAQGTTHYQLGEFAEALVQYKRAYELVPLSGFLFNIGQCHFSLEQYEDAIHFYEGYLRESPDGKNVELVTQRLAQAKERVAEAQRVAEEEARRAEEHAKAEAAQQEAAAAQAAAAEEEARLERERAAQESELNNTILWGGTIGGAVLVSTVVIGATVAAIALSGPGVEVVPPSGSLGTLDRR